MVKKNSINWIQTAIIIILLLILLCYLNILPAEFPICKLLNGGDGGGGGGGGGGGDGDGDGEGDDPWDNGCNDPDWNRANNGIWIGTTTTGLLGSGTDDCLSVALLREYTCDEVGNVIYFDVDCRSYSSWCNPTINACAKMACASVYNPQSQVDCNAGIGCSDTEFCRFIDGGLMGINTCECSEPTTCAEACLFEGYTTGWCSEIMQKNPCGLTGTSFLDYKELCGGYFSDETCCCA